MIFWDIETLALPPEQLAAVKPEFKAPANFKAPDKIAAAIADKEAEWLEKAALSAATAKIALIGYLDREYEAEMGDEKRIIEDFWHRYQKRDGFWYGHNIKEFDIPFIVQRSWVNSIKVPAEVYVGRYPNQRFIDLMEVWSCFRRGQYASLDTIAKALGLGGKLGSGKDFGKMWAEDKEKAIAYNRHELGLMKQIAERMGL